MVPGKGFVVCLYHMADFYGDLCFCSAVPTKRATLPQHPGKAASKASESSSSEESSDEEEEDKKKKPVQVCSFGKERGLLKALEKRNLKSWLLAYDQGMVVGIQQVIMGKKIWEL